MRSSIIAFAALPGVIATNGCNANNCARDVTGTRARKVPIETRQADCSLFMTTTVYATPVATAAPAPIFQRKRAADNKRAVDGEPVTVTGTMPAYVSQCPDIPAYSSACSCWGFPAAVTTITVPTTTVTAGPAATCTKGMDYAYYGLPQGSGAGQVPVAGGPAYSSLFDAALVLGGQTPFSTGHSKSFSFAGENGCNSGRAVVDGQIQPVGSHSDFAVTQHIGYLSSEQAGDFHVNAAADELVLGWFGPLAKAGWTTANAQLVSDAPGKNYIAVSAAAGEYIPFRLVYVNAQTCSGVSVEIMGPDGVILLSTDTIDTPNMVSSCSGPGLGDKAPAFSF